MGASYLWGGLAFGLCCVPALVYGTCWWVGRHRLRAKPAAGARTSGLAPGAGGVHTAAAGRGLAALGDQIDRAARERPPRASLPRSGGATEGGGDPDDATEPAAERILARTSRPRPRPATVVYPTRSGPVPRARRPPGVGSQPPPDRRSPEGEPGGDEPAGGATGGP